MARKKKAVVYDPIAHEVYNNDAVYIPDCNHIERDPESIAEVLLVILSFLILVWRFIDSVSKFINLFKPAGLENELNFELESEPESDSELESDSEPESESERDSESDPESEREWDSQSESESEPEPRPRSRRQRQSKRK